MVCRTVGLREHWYFDLDYIDANETRFWLKRHKKVPVSRCLLFFIHADDLIRFQTGA